MALNGRLARASLRAQANARQGERRLALDLKASGGHERASVFGTSAWQATVEQLNLALDPAPAGQAGQRLARGHARLIIAIGARRLPRPARMSTPARASCC